MLTYLSDSMKVFNLVGLADEIISAAWPLEQLWDFSSKGELLGGSDFTKDFVEKYTQPGMGVKRTTLNLMLKEVLLANGIECREGWALENLTEASNGMTAHFNGDRTASGAFIVGCDGIKAKSREIVLKQYGIKPETPVYTGLSQVSAGPME